MLGNPVGWFEIYVNDMDRAKQFYQEVFQVTLSKLDSPGGIPLDMWVFSDDMGSYGATGALVKMDDMAAGGNSTIVYFSCEDCAIEEKRALMNGGTLQMSKMAIGEFGFISLVMDTEGNVIGLHSMN